MNTPSQKQLISPSNYRRALPVVEKVDEYFVSDVLDGLIACHRMECCNCPYNGFFEKCVQKLNADAPKAVRFVTDRRKAYVPPQITVVRETEDDEDAN